MMPRRIVTLKRWQVGLAFMAITAAFVASLVWIQDGRLSSCKRTYEGVREVFKPFLTPPPKPGDSKRYHDYVKFNDRVDELKGQCDRQIKLWWP